MREDDRHTSKGSQPLLGPLEHVDRLHPWGSKELGPVDNYNRLHTIRSRGTNVRLSIAHHHPLLESVALVLPHEVHPTNERLLVTRIPVW